MQGGVSLTGPVPHKPQRHGPMTNWSKQAGAGAGDGRGGRTGRPSVPKGPGAADQLVEMAGGSSLAPSQDLPTNWSRPVPSPRPRPPSGPSQRNFQVPLPRPRPRFPDQLVELASAGPPSRPLQRGLPRHHPGPRPTGLTRSHPDPGPCVPPLLDGQLVLPRPAPAPVPSDHL